MQRVVQYPMMLDRLKKNTSSEEAVPRIKEAMKLMSDLADAFNSCAK